MSRAASQGGVLVPTSIKRTALRRPVMAVAWGMLNNAGPGKRTSDACRPARPSSSPVCHRRGHRCPILGAFDEPAGARGSTSFTNISAAASKNRLSDAGADQTVAASGIAVADLFVGCIIRHPLLFWWCFQTRLPHTASGLFLLQSLPTRSADRGWAE